MQTFTITNIKEIIKTVKNANTRLIYIAWASASGKSYFAKLLANTLRNQNNKKWVKNKVLEISSDDYYSNETDLQFLLYGTFDHPKLIDYKLLQKNINEYIKTWRTKLPKYSFTERRRIGYTEINSKLNKNDKYDYIIVEWLYTIDQLSHTHNPFKIFVHSDTEELIFRRIIRDQKRITESIDTIVWMLWKVFPMRKIYGETQEKESDMKIDNDYAIMKKEGKRYQCKLLKKEQLKKLKQSKKFKTAHVIKKEFINDFIYNDGNNNNWVIYVSEIYKTELGLIDHVTITKSKHKDYTKDSYDRIVVPLYKPGSLTMIHTLLQTAWLKLIGQNKKVEYSYKYKDGQGIKLKKSRNKRYIVK